VDGGDREEVSAVPRGAVIYLLSCVVSTMVFAQTPAVVPVDQEISLADVLRLVDPQYPGLQDFAAAMAANDLPRAQQLLIQHFAVRTKPVIPPATAPGVSEDMSICRLTKASPAQAEAWLKHVFTESNNDVGKMETFDLGLDIQWMRNPSQAPSWLAYVNQLRHLNSLAGLYQETKDERLATEIGKSVLTWSRQCPCGYATTDNEQVVKSAMEVRNRLCNLLVTYEVVRKSPVLTPEMHLAFWKVFIASARELMTYEACLTPD